LKILVVDDSIVFRSAITQALQSIPGLDVFRSVVNGKLAIDILKLHPDIDLITLDMEMPILDGLETIKEIRKFNKDVTIIVFSSQTLKGAEKTIEALGAGADDFVAKTIGTGQVEESLEKIKEDLLPKILAFKERKLKRSKITEQSSSENFNAKDISKSSVTNTEMPIKPKLIVIGVSTGGPEALTCVFKTITEKITVPMLIVQHMPALFTEKLATMLSKLSPVEVREAKQGDKLIPGVCLLAPGDFHMTISKNGEIVLTQNEKVCFVRPSVDVLLDSIAQNYEKQILNIIMTGMGEDGANGTRKLNSKGAYTFIQNRETCIVWGMPGAVQKAIGDQARNIPLGEIGFLINAVSKRL
jgi:two-component system chemotaxis response regulator CheB